MKLSNPSWRVVPCHVGTRWYKYDAHGTHGRGLFLNVMFGTSTHLFHDAILVELRTDWFSKPLDSPKVSVTGASISIDQGYSLTTNRSPSGAGWVTRTSWVKGSWSTDLSKSHLHICSSCPLLCNDAWVALPAHPLGPWPSITSPLAHLADLWTTMVWNHGIASHPMFQHQHWLLLQVVLRGRAGFHKLYLLGPIWTGAPCVYLQWVVDYHQEVLNVRSDSVTHSPLHEFQVLEPPFWHIVAHQQLHWLPGSAKYTAKWQLGRSMHWLQGFAQNLSWLQAGRWEKIWKRFVAKGNTYHIVPTSHLNIYL